MTTCIALFRGINVGGNNKLPMKELTSSEERRIHPMVEVHRARKTTTRHPPEAAEVSRHHNVKQDELTQ